MRSSLPALLIMVILSLIPVTAFPASAPSPVTKAHLLMITSLFRDNGLREASARTDSGGRVLLTGNYKDSREVSLAFSLAQSVVGVKWTSPVAPENVKVREWAQKLASFFPTTKGKQRDPQGRAGRAAGKTKYGVVVGVSRFKNDSTGKNRLRYAANDALDVYSYLLLYKDYRKENLALLIDEQATRQNIQAALDNLAERAQPGDEIFIYFSSHGAPVYDGSLNIVTYDTVFKNHFTMSDSSFPSKSLKRFLDRTRSQSVFVLLDVCYSGAAFKDIDGFYYAGSKSISFDEDNQGFSRKALATTFLGAKDVVLEEGERAGPKVIISASDAGERSWESDSIRASFFTHHLLQELRKKADLKSAFEVARPRVTKDVRTEKKAEQNPQAIASSSDWGADN